MDLQPVGIGTFGMVWYVCHNASPRCDSQKLKGMCYIQLGTRPIDKRAGSDQEDHEAIQYSNPV